jgi:hypothetical protein
MLSLSVTALILPVTVLYAKKSITFGARQNLAVAPRMILKCVQMIQNAMKMLLKMALVTQANARLRLTSLAIRRLFSAAWVLDRSQTLLSTQVMLAKQHAWTRISVVYGVGCALIMAL